MPEDPEITTFVMNVDSGARTIKVLGYIFLVAGIAMIGLGASDGQIPGIVGGLLGVAPGATLLYGGYGHLQKPAITLTETGIQWSGAFGSRNSCPNGQFVFKKKLGDSFDRYCIQTFDGRLLMLDRTYENYDLLLAKLQQRAVQPPTPPRP